MRDILQAAGLVAAILAGTAFVWIVLAAPGFLSDSASNVPNAARQEVLR